MAETDIEHAERIRALEVDRDNMRTTLAEVRDDVKALLQIVEQAKGAKYVLVLGGGAIGAIATSAIINAKALAAWVLAGVAK